MTDTTNSFKFVVTTETRLKHEPSVVSEIRAHSARAIHRARRKRKEAKTNQQSLESSFLSPAPMTSVNRQRSSCSDDLATRQLALPLAFKGNSDPFQATAINMTPEMNEILTYMRDEVYPKLQFNGFFRHFASDDLDLSVLSNTICITSFPASQHWDFITSTLENECSALASLSTAASYMGTIKPEKQITALELRLQSSKHLRRLLARQDQDITLLASTLFWLFNAETRAGNFAAAAMLAGLLAPILKRSFELGTGSLMIIMEFRVVEDDVATKNLSRVSLDMDVWFPSLFDKDWKQAETLLPPFQWAMDDIHPAVQWPLRRHFHNLRWIYFYWDRPFRCKCPQDQQLVLRWFMSRYQWISGCLLNAYADLAENHSQSSAKQMQCLLALTALEHTRVVGTSSVVGSVEYRGSSKPVIGQVKKLAEALSDNANSDRDVADALLWVFCLGSSWEAITGGVGEDAWFHSRLLTLARDHNVRTWSGCRFILKSFFFVEKDVHDISEWFEEAMRGVRVSMDLEI